MLRTVHQMQMEAVRGFADHNAFLGQRDFRVGGIGEVGHEYVFPDGRSLGVSHVLNIENVFGEAFVEDAGLNLEGDLRALEFVF